MDFGEKIKSLREKRNLTRSRLAEALGIKYSTLSNYENGVRQPDFDTLKLIARFFSVSTDYLLEETNNDNYSNRNTSYTLTEDDEIRLLIDESRHISKEDLQIVINLLQRMSKKDQEA